MFANAALHAPPVTTTIPVSTPHCKGAPRIVHWGGARPKGRKPRVGVWFLGGASNRSPPAVSSPAGFGVEPGPPKGFPLFSALRMTSPDIININIVNCARSHWESRPPSPPPLRMPLPHSRPSVSASSRTTFMPYGPYTIPLSALTLLVGPQEGHLACKKLSVGLQVVTI